MNDSPCEGSLELRFDDPWIQLKWDDCPAYRKGIEKLQNTKSVDYLARLKKRRLRLVEIKDFVGHQRDNQSRVGENLAQEVAEKVRDTLAGLVGARRSFPDEIEWKTWLELLSDGVNLDVVLWLEEESFPKTTYGKRRKAARLALKQKLKAKLSWLGAGNCNVALASIDEPISGLRARRREARDNRRGK
jgi:hypothetical protein